MRITQGFPYEGKLSPEATDEVGAPSSLCLSRQTVHPAEVVDEMCIRDRSRMPDVFVVEKQEEDEQKLTDDIPVSYTHLDVYKRQAISCRWRKSRRFAARGGCR